MNADTKTILLAKLIKKIGLEFFPSKEFAKEMINLLRRDKISLNGNINLILLRRFGDFKILSNIPEEIIYESIVEPLI